MVVGSSQDGGLQVFTITNEEARAAVETELFAMKLTKPMTPAEKDAFCEIAKSRLNYQSNSYRIKEIHLWVESWQSLWLPEKHRCRCRDG